MSLTTNLVAYYKLDESSGNATDSVGGFTLSNTGTTSFAAAKINNGADFGASNTTKYLSTANNLGIDGGAITLSTWMKPTALPSSDPDPFATSTPCFVSQSSASASVFYSLHLANVSGTQRVYFARHKNSVGSVGAYFDTSVSTSAFTHVVGTYDGTNLQVYVNNVSGTGTTDSGSGTGGVNRFALSTRASASFNFYSGAEDETVVWSRGISAGEVSSLFNSGAGLAYPLVLPSVSSGLMMGI